MNTQSPTTLNLPPLLLAEVQKVVVINTCSVVRKSLCNEDQFSDEEADNR
jgi:hypothetical protein